MDTRLTATHDTRRLLLAIIVVLAVVMGLGATSASAAPPTVCRVQNTDTGTTYQALQPAVDAASRGARLIVRGTCVGTTIIGKEILIEGIRTATSGKPTLSGAGKSRVVRVAKSASVELRNIDVVRGKGGRGAGILNAGDLLLRDVLVRDNEAVFLPSVVYNDGTLRLSGSTAISRNPGGSLNVLENQGSVTMGDDSSISGNTTDGVSNSGTLTLNDDSAISGNLAWYYGVGNDGTLTLNDSSSISGNNGRGVTNYGTLTLNDSSSISGNNGGGVDNNGTLTMNGSSSISGNTVGDGVYMGGGTLTMNGSSSISGNKARDDRDGGGVYHLRGTLTGVICAPEAGANVHDNTPDDCYQDSALSLPQARALHTATLLLDGRVLVVGGTGGDGYVLPSAEIWGPTTASFGPTGSPADARKGHTATLLSDGRVLVVGGADDDGILTSAEVWDAATGQFGPTASLAKARSGHTATLLPDGRVLVVGGRGEGEDAPRLTSAEVWDPVTGEFARAGRLAEARVGHTATPLPDGRVLVVGGDAVEMALASAEVWDPATSTFALAGSLAEARAYHTATSLPDGRVLIIGDVDFWDPEPTGKPKSLEVWDPATSEFALAGSLAETRWFHTATLLPDGRVLVVGGSGLFAAQPTSAEFWDPATDQAAPAGPLAKSRVFHTATLLPDGHVLIVGGSDQHDELALAEVWTGPGQGRPQPELPSARPEGTPAADEQPPATDEQPPAAGQFTPAGSLADARDDHTATSLADGRVLMIGGDGAGGDTLASAEVWDPVTAQSASAGSLAEARAYHTATSLPDGRILVVGGTDGDSVVTGEIWDPATGRFAPAGSLARARVNHTATLLHDGRVVIIGGIDWTPTEPPISDYELRTRVEVWDPAAGEFAGAGKLAKGRTGHTASLLSDGRVLVVGGHRGGFVSGEPLASAEVWDPDTGAFSPAGSLAEARAYHTATSLPDGRVLVVGGWRGVASAEVWDPATATFSPAGSLAKARESHTATLLPDGRVLVVGGWSDEDNGRVATAEVWDPEAESFSPAGSLAEARSGHTATLVPDGRVLVLGGRGDGILASAEVWEPSDG